MMSWTLLLFVAAGLIAGFLGWGAYLLRRNLGSSMQRLAAVEVASIPTLAEECRRTVRERLEIDLDPRDLDGTARVLDELVLTGRLRPLFKTPGYEMAYAEPAGAFIGELIRRHVKAEWMEDELSPRLVVWRGEVPVDLHPFVKAVRHHTHGSPGELHRYVMDAVGSAGGAA